MQKIKKGNVKEITIALAIFVCAMVIIGGIILYAAETNTTADGNYEYIVLEDGTVSITKYIGTATNVTIPGEIEGKTVTSIGTSAFLGCTSLTSIVLPEGVTSIGSDSFKSCSSLTSIKIPEGVTGIERRAFYGCKSLTSIEIPEGVTSIDDYAFSGCSSLTSIEIPNSVVYIFQDAFSNCSSLTSIKISNSVISIGNYVFSGCSSLTSINIPNRVTSIGDSTFSGCSSLTSIEIPSSVTSIDDFAFFCCSGLTSITIPNSVTSIGGHAFSGCTSLTSIEIPSSVTSIGGYAFYGCTSLTSIEIPRSITTIGRRAFGFCKIIKVTTRMESIQEIELPEIIKRVMDEEDILYSSSDFKLTNCTLSEDKTKLIVDVETVNTKTVSIGVVDGALDGLSVVVVPSGTITYSDTSWINENVIATVYIAEGEEIINNNGKNTYIFTENGEFTFEYKDIDGNVKKATAKVTNIDKQVPTIESVTGNPVEWTNQNVTLTINGATDEHSGLTDVPYSFDGGETWQAENTKTYEENTEGILIKVKDALGNIYTHDTINITKIHKTHTEVVDEAVVPTCTETGLEAGSHCSVCNEVLVAQEIIPAIGHTEVVDARVEPTCTETGLETGSHCSVCGDVLEEQQPILAIGHNYESGECTNCGEKAPEITVETEKYNIEEGILTQIAPQTTLETLIQEIETNATKVEIYNADNELVEEDKKIATGMKLKLELYGQEKEYTLAVLGDTNGDGEADFKDILQINKHRLNKTPLQGEYLKAGDVTENGEVDFSDILKVNKYRLGKINSL